MVLCGHHRSVGSCATWQCLRCANGGVCFWERLQGDRQQMSVSIDGAQLLWRCTQEGVEAGPRPEQPARGFRWTLQVVVWFGL